MANLDDNDPPGGIPVAGGGGEETPQAVEAVLVIGGMISAIGVGVLVMAAANLHNKWFEDWPAPGWATICMLTLLPAVALFFMAVNPELDGVLLLRRRQDDAEWAAFKADPKPSGPFRPSRLLEASWGRRRLFSGLGAVYAVIVGVGLIGWTDAANHRPPRVQQFAIALPAPDIRPACPEDGPCRLFKAVLEKASETHVAPDKAVIETATQDAARAKASEDARAAVPPAVLTWWVEDKRSDKAPAGVLPLALGGLFLTVLGFWFPHVGLAKFSEASGFTSKLVAPLLSLALVGLGVGQQAEASRIAGDEKLAERGLPATINVPRDQKPVQVTTYLPPDSKPSPEALKDIAKSLDSLSEQIKSDRRDQLVEIKNNTSAISDLAKSVGEVANQIGKFPKAQPTPAPDPGNVEKGLKSIVDAAGERDRKELEARCTLLVYRRDLATNEASRLKPEPKQATDVFSRGLRGAGRWLAGKPTPAEATRTEASRKAKVAEAKDVQAQLRAASCPQAGGWTPPED